MTRETWRVVLADGSVREVTVVADNASRPLRVIVADGDRRRYEGCSARNAIAGLAWYLDWDIADIRAPGESTTAECDAVGKAVRRVARESE